MDFDPIAYLTSKGIQGRPSGSGEVTYPCFFDCGEPSDSRKRKLYVNKTTGMYECKVCLAFGGPTKLQQHFGDVVERNAENGRSDFSPTKLEVLAVAARIAHEMCVNSEEALEYLLGDDRNLPAEVITGRKYGYVPRMWSLCGQMTEYRKEDLQAAGLMTADGRDFYAGKVIIPFIQDGRVVQLRAKDPKEGGYRTPAGDRVRLYGVDDVRGASDVVIVEGEFDAGMLAYLLSQSPDPKVNSLRVCAVPGVQVWPEDADAILAEAKRIFIATDPDEPGRRGAEKILEKVGPRGRILEWPEQILERPLADGLELKNIDWSLLIGRYGYTWQDFLHMMREASGRRLLTVAEAAARLKNRPTSGGIRLGFEQIDGWLAPGLLPGQLMIPLAKTGTGKTLLLCNIAYNNRKRPVLFVSLEMTAEEVYERLARIYRFYYPYATEDEIAAALANILICDENRLTERDLQTLIDEYEYETGNRPELLLLDYLGYYARGQSGGSPYEKTSNAVMQLKAEAKKHKVAVIAPHQVNRSATDGRPIDADDARDSGVVEETADFVVSIYRPDDALSVNGQPTGVIKMAILKSRHGNRDRVASLQMGMLSLVITDAQSKWSKAARQESIEAANGHTYESYMRTRTAPVQKELA